MKKMKKMLAVVVAAILALSMIGCSGSEQFPDGDITIVVPFGSGGGTDLLARILAESAQEHLEDATVIVSNVTGASGTVGTGEVANSEPDGYNLIFNASGPMVVQPHLMEDLQYTIDDFKSIVCVASEPSCIAVRADSPYQTLDDLLAAQDELLVGNTGTGTVHYLFQSKFFADTEVPYKLIAFEGGAKLVTGLLGGEVDVMSTVVSEMYQYVESGEIRILAVSSAERSELYPDIPTVKEYGFDIDMSLDFFLQAPAEVPEENLNILIDSFGKDAESDAVKEYLTNAHVTASVVKGAEYDAKLKESSDAYAAIVAGMELK